MTFPACGAMIKWLGGGIGRRPGLEEFERCCRNTANEPESIGKRCKIPIPRQTVKTEAVETAIRASRPDDGTVQTTNRKGSENYSGKKILCP